MDDISQLTQQGGNYDMDSSKDSERFYSEIGLDVEDLFAGVGHEMFNLACSQKEQDCEGKI